MEKLQALHHKVDHGHGSLWKKQALINSSVTMQTSETSIALYSVLLLLINSGPMLHGGLKVEANQILMKYQKLKCYFQEKIIISYRNNHHHQHRHRHRHMHQVRLHFYRR